MENPNKGGATTQKQETGSSSGDGGGDRDGGGGVVDVDFRVDDGGLVTKEMVDHFEREGWLVVPGVLARDKCEDAIREIKRFLAARCDVHIDGDMESWERWPMSQQGFCECYCLPSMWDARQNADIYRIFAALTGVKELWVSIDRAGVKRPGVIRSGHTTTDKSSWHRDAFVHTDCNLWFPPRQLEIQGLLALDDTEVGQGGFACIPGFHNEFREWCEANPRWKVKDAKKKFNKFMDEDMIKSRMKQIPVKAGDFLLWNNLLPHCNTRNVSEKWRYCFYIRMFRATSEYEQLRRYAVDSYLHGRRPLHFATGGTTPKDWATIEMGKHFQQPPELTPLGRRLVGIDNWDGSAYDGMTKGSSDGDVDNGDGAAGSKSSTTTGEARRGGKGGRGGRGAGRGSNRGKRGDRNTRVVPGNK